MKTVMKKMFCLLLVAVLLVSAVPAAFAEGTCDGHEWDGGVVTTQPTCIATGIRTYTCANGCTELETLPATGNHAWTSEITTPATCSKTGIRTHTCSAGSHTEEEVLAIDSSNHTYSNGICTGCGLCQSCKQASCICCDKCDGTTLVHASNCPTQLCPKGCGAKAHTGVCCAECGEYGHQKSACDTLYETCCNVAKGSAHRSDCVTRCTEKRDCKNANHKAGCLYALCDTNGCTENEGHTGEHTGVPCSDSNCNKYLGHSGKHSYLCPNAGCDKAVGHSGNCSNVPETIAGDSYLTVNVNLYTSDVKTGTIHLKTYKNISSETKVYNFISDHANEIKSLLPAGYTWGGNVYDSENNRDAEHMNAKVGNGRTVYINAYSAEDLVLIYVHNSRSMTPIRIIQMYGKKVGETVTKSEVKKAVSKYYNINSLSMYSEQAWEDYVDGKSVQKVDSLKVTSEPFFIDVKISGSATSSSSSGSTADSSNPKTGDEIFVPVMILGLSASALAVLFYLNKKHAY